MDDQNKGFYVDLVCKQPFFDVERKEFEKQCGTLLEGIKQKLFDAHAAMGQQKNFVDDIKGCQLEVGWRS